LTCCSCFLEICFLLLSLFFLPPLSPIARSFHIVSLYPPRVPSSRCEFAFCLSLKSKYHRFSVLAICRLVYVFQLLSVSQVQTNQLFSM
jgi:hypothetical protein